MRTFLIALFVPCLLWAQHPIVSKVINPASVLSFTFDEGPGAKDWSRFDHQTVNDGADWSSASGFGGGAFKFVAANTDSIAVGGVDDFVTFTKGTISAWLYKSSDVRQTIIGVGDPGVANDWIQFGAWASADTTLRYMSMYDRGSGGSAFRRSFDATTPIAVGKWHHVAVTGDGTGVGAWTLFAAGRPVALTGLGAGTWWSAVANGIMLLGATARSPTTFWSNGFLEDVFMWDRVLTDAEIRDLYETGKAKQ